jgi:integrase
VVRLKVKHIDAAQRIIRVEQAKGRKDRQVMLSRKTLDLLRQWRKVRPTRCDAPVIQFIDVLNDVLPLPFKSIGNISYESLQRRLRLRSARDAQ